MEIGDPPQHVTEKKSTSLIVKFFNLDKFVCDKTTVT